MRLRERAAAWFLKISMKLDASPVTAVIETRSNDLALRLARAWLERHGLVHCSVCASRFGLMKQGGIYFCKNHMPKTNGVAHV